MCVCVCVCVCVCDVYVCAYVYLWCVCVLCVVHVCVCVCMCVCAVNMSSLVMKYCVDSRVMHDLAKDRTSACESVRVDSRRNLDLVPSSA